MKALELDVRYYHQPRISRVNETDFQHNTLHWTLPIDEIALVLVDVWSDHYVTTHLQRGRDITLECIKPVLETFRKIGAAVIHAPSPACAQKYPQWTQFAGDKEVKGASANSRDDWPPAEFRSKSEEYEKWARPKEPRDQVFEDIITNRRIIPEVEPKDGDYVIVNGDQLHRVLSHRKILHLFYVGFAANMCIPFRDYGTRAMKDRGYDIVLIRDCTSAIEVEHTAEDLMLSQAAVIDTELNVGYTTSSSDLVAACEKIA